MSTLWNVEVAALDGAAVTLHVVRAHPDAGGFHADPVFALRLLHEPAIELDDDYEPVPAGPLGAAVDEDALLSESWAAEHAPAYVAGVAVESAGDVATYTIAVTDSKWLAHLEPGRRWRSAAFS